jgi:dTDP-glucose 4,6-dehydratase
MKKNRSVRSLTIHLADLVAWVASYQLALILRFDGFSIDSKFILTGFLFSLLSALLFFTIRITLHRFVRKYKIGNVEELLSLTIISVIITLLFFINLNINRDLLPRSIPLISLTLFITFASVIRFFLRLFVQGIREKENKIGTLLYGLGEIGEIIIRVCNYNQESKFIILAAIDDDPSKKLLNISGVSVEGSFKDIEEIIQEKRIKAIIVAITDIESRRLNQLKEVAIKHGLQLNIVPPRSSLLGEQFEIEKIHELDFVEQVSRRKFKTDEDEIAQLFKNKRILVTGGGGSIGSEIIKQLFRYHPAEIGILDRDESALHSVQLITEGRALLTSRNLFLCDIRDEKRVIEIFSGFKPEVVFHAAALKHLTLLENNPSEAWKTNVEGTKNILSASNEVGVKVFVNISTDKAADPTSVLGITKLETEKLTLFYSKKTKGKYMSVRFGNVIGSRGSVIPTFQYQIDSGGPLTITHPEVKRFMMSIPEAVHLVFQSAAVGVSGDTLALEMGEQISIEEIAKKMIEKSGKQIEIVYTGLRQGEKLNEKLIGKNEHFEKITNNEIYRIRISS